MAGACPCKLIYGGCVDEDGPANDAGLDQLAGANRLGAHALTFSRRNVSANQDCSTKRLSGSFGQIFDEGIPNDGGGFPVFLFRLFH
jgi:hypothetical protein